MEVHWVLRRASVVKEEKELGGNVIYEERV